MYKQYDNGNLFQIGFGTGYGYIQEVGEIQIDVNFKKSFVVVYERSFAKKIIDTKELSDEKYFVGRFLGIPSEVCRGSENHPVRQTERGSEFDYGSYKDSQTGKFKRKYIYVKNLGLHPVLGHIEFPEYLREDDYNFITGTYRWLIMTPSGDFVKQQKTARGIEHMPPDLVNFITCARWWEDGLTLETYNDEYCLRVIERRYSEEPELRPIKMSFDGVVETMPTKKWRGDSSDEKRNEWYSKIEDMLRQFVAALSSEEKVSLRQVKKAVKELTIRLNGIQDEELFIETSEGDELFTFISNILRVKKMSSAVDVLEEYRDW